MNLHGVDASAFKDCDDCYCFAARRAARAITQLYERHLRPSGLHATQFTLLTFLIRAGASPMQKAAGYLGMERTTLTRNLRPLLSRGLVELETGADRRIRRIRITDEGRAAAKNALPLWRKAQREAEKTGVAPAAASKL